MLLSRYVYKDQAFGVQLPFCWISFSCLEFQTKEVSCGYLEPCFAVFVWICITTIEILHEIFISFRAYLSQNSCVDIGPLFYGTSGG